MCPQDFINLKPKAKGDLFLVGDEIVYKYEARLGRHVVKLPGEPSLWETEAQALDAATRFRDKCRAAKG